MVAKKKSDEPAQPTRIRVRALNNVLGLQSGQEAEVLPTHEVEVLINSGHLEWIDAPKRNEDEKLAELVDVAVEGGVENPEVVSPSTDD